MRVHRTHDGRSFDISQPLSQFRSREELFDVIAATIEVASEDVICMTRSGQQVNDDVLDQLQENEERGPSSSRKDVTVEFFLFNRQYLYADLEPLVREMEEMSPLEMPAEEPELVHPPTPRLLDALLDWCSILVHNMIAHNARSEQCLAQLRIIDEGTRAALSNLLSHAASVNVGADELQLSAKKELDRMQGLLRGHETDLRILSMVQVNPKLLPAPEGAKGPPKERNLANYVSPAKMGAVFQACASVHTELERNLDVLHSNGVQLSEDTTGLRLEVQSTDVEPSNETVQEAVQALARAQDLQRFLQANIAPDENGWPAAERIAKDDGMMRAVEDAAGELILLDEVCRESLRRLSADKNDMMARSLHLLSDISSLQSEYADLSIDLAQLDKEFQSNRTDGFRHLARLKNMLWAYGSTLIEIHRRREFEKHFLVRSQALAELMANFSEGERRRRVDFRAQVVGALPWDIKGMEENTPNLEISTTGPGGNGNSVLDVSREDVDNLFKLLDDIEKKLKNDGQDAALNEVRSSMQKLLSQIEEADAEFVRLVETGLLGQAGDTDTDEEEQSLRPQTRQDRVHLEKAMQELKIEHGERERSLAEHHDRQMSALHAELSRLKTDLRSAEHSLEQERQLHDESRRALETVRSDAETEATRRINMQDELTRLRQDHEAARRAQKDAQAEAREESERANELEAHLHDVQLELDEFRTAHADASKRVEALLSKGTSFEHELQVAQERIDELTKHLSEARSDVRHARDALSEAEAARDKALRTYRAEADGDRAILEESLRSKTVNLDEAQALFKRKESELAEHVDTVKNLQSQLTAADAAHEELVRELENTKEARMDAEMAKRQSERNLNAVSDKVRVLMSKAILLFDALKRMPTLSGQASKNGSKSAQETVGADEEVDEKNDQQRRIAFEAFKTAGDEASFESVLDVLSWLTKSVSAEEIAIGKLDSLTTLCKKWMKAYKHANEKGQRQQLILREKITFRHFAVGDLALFLPTRSNVASSAVSPGKQDNGAANGTIGAAINFAKPWAAFNINFPHFFLNFSGRPENEQLRDSLRQKEWIVARIVKIESRIASSSEPEGNPFQLTEGVKFYLLDVENWNLANSIAAPNVSRRKSASTVQSSANEGRSQQQRHQEQHPPPPLRRWESTPDGVIATKPSTSDDVSQMEDEKGTDKSPSLLPQVAEENPPPVFSPSSAVPLSGLSLSLQQRTTSPELLRNSRAAQRGSVPNADGSNDATLASSRWTAPVSTRGLAKAGGTAASVTSTSSMVSEKQANRLAEGATPAFGRSKHRTFNHAAGSYGARQNGDASLVSSPSSRHTVGSAAVQLAASHSLPKDGNGNASATPINAAQHVIRITSEETTPNPFSASPATGFMAGGGGGAELHGMTGYFAARRRESDLHKTNSDNESEDKYTGRLDKGKGKQGGSRSDTIEADADAATLAVDQRSSISSRLSALNIKSRPAAIAASRIRTAPVLRPTMEVVQGLNSFGRSASASDDDGRAVAESSSSAVHMPSSSSGFSMASAGSTSAAGSSGLSLSMVRPPQQQQRIGSSPQQRTMSISSTAASVDPTSSSAKSVRRSSMFGSVWTLGRSSGGQAARNRGKNSERADNDDIDDGRSTAGADLSATVTDAQQSLRRLAGYR